MNRWCKALGTKRLNSYLFPTLTNKQKFNRIDFALNEVGVPSMKFGEKLDEVMIDEAWYYLRTDGTRIRMLKNPDGTWSTFEVERTRNKRYLEVWENGQ